MHSKIQNEKNSEERHLVIQNMNKKRQEDETVIFRLYSPDRMIHLCEQTKFRLDLEMERLLGKVKAGYMICIAVSSCMNKQFC